MWPAPGKEHVISARSVSLASGLRPGPLGQKRNVAVLDVVGLDPVAPDVGFYSGMEREHDHLAGSVARDGRRVELDGTGWTAVLM
jgi:hypothetical protein